MSSGLLDEDEYNELKNKVEIEKKEYKNKNII